VLLGLIVAITFVAARDLDSARPAAVLARERAADAVLVEVDRAQLCRLARRHAYADTIPSLLFTGGTFMHHAKSVTEAPAGRSPGVVELREALDDRVRAPDRAAAGGFATGEYAVGRRGRSRGNVDHKRVRRLVGDMVEGAVKRVLLRAPPSAGRRRRVPPCAAARRAV